jgi:hypothetical protein
MRNHEEQKAKTTLLASSSSKLRETRHPHSSFSMNAKLASIKQNKQTTLFRTTRDQRAHEQSHITINHRFRAENG